MMEVVKTDLLSTVDHICYNYFVTERKGLFGPMASFFKGVSRLFTLEGESSDYPFLGKSDAEAIRSDWEMVGNDIRRATEKFVSENTVKEEKSQ